MSNENISPNLRRFILNTINSVEQLEVLLFLMSNPETEWSAQEISSRIRVTPDSVAHKLDQLHSAKLLTHGDGINPLYRYAPTSSAIASEVAQSLNRAYREGKDTVIELIYSRPLDNIRIFADAFKINQEEEE